MEWLELEWTLKTIKVPTPCHGQGYHPPAQAAQGPIQAGLEHLQGWGIHSFSGQPVPLLYHPQSIDCTHNDNHQSLTRIPGSYVIWWLPVVTWPLAWKVYSAGHTCIHYTHLHTQALQFLQLMVWALVLFLGRSVWLFLVLLLLVSVLGAIIYFIHTAQQITYFPFALPTEIKNRFFF